MNPFAPGFFVTSRIGRPEARAAEHFRLQDAARMQTLRPPAVLDRERTEFGKGIPRQSD